MLPTLVKRDIVVQLKDVPSNHVTVTLDPPVITVWYRVPLSQYEYASRAMDFLATVSYAAIREDTTGYVEPRLELPEDIYFQDVYIVPSELRYYDLLIDE